MIHNGIREFNAPGARTIAEAVPLTIDGERVIAEVRDGSVWVTHGTTVLYSGALPSEVNSFSDMHAWVCAMVEDAAEPEGDEYRRFIAGVQDGEFIIAEQSPTKAHPINWMGAEVTRENAWDAAQAQGCPVVFVDRSGNRMNLGDCWSRNAFEFAMYCGYVSYGRSMADGYYAPLSFENWVKAFRKAPHADENDAPQEVKNSLPRYV